MAVANRTRAAHLGPERRRPLVLDAALPLFAADGFDGVSIERIAEAAGVTRPVVYDCYPNKHALFGALLDREQQRLVQETLDALPTVPRLDDIEVLLADGFVAFLTTAARHPHSWRLVFDASPRVAGARSAVTERLEELATAVLAARGLRDAQRGARVTAYMLAGLAQAGVRLMLDHPGEWDPAKLGALLGRMAAPGEQMLESA